jgi:hypothetical protein
MFKYIQRLLCPHMVGLEHRLTEATALIEELTINVNLLRARNADLNDMVSDKLSARATSANKLSVSAHAIKRYKDRYNSKASDDEVSKKLYNALLKQLGSMDTLPDGKYSIDKGVTGVVQNHTLVTILPKRGRHQLS